MHKTIIWKLKAKIKKHIIGIGWRFAMLPTGIWFKAQLITAYTCKTRESLDAVSCCYHFKFRYHIDFNTLTSSEWTINWFSAAFITNPLSFTDAFKGLITTIFPFSKNASTDVLSIRTLNSKIYFPGSFWINWYPLMVSKLLSKLIIKFPRK